MATKKSTKAPENPIDGEIVPENGVAVFQDNTQVLKTPRMITFTNGLEKFKVPEHELQELVGMTLAQMMFEALNAASGASYLVDNEPMPGDLVITSELLATASEFKLAKPTGVKG